MKLGMIRLRVNKDRSPGSVDVLPQKFKLERGVYFLRFLHWETYSLRSAQIRTNLARRLPLIHALSILFCTVQGPISS